MPIMIRWAIIADYQAIAEIERQCFGPHALPVKSIASLCGEWRMLAYVATIGWPTAADGSEYVVGWLALELQAESMHIHRLAVAPKFQRRGIATALLRRIGRRPHGHRTEATVFVDEDRLGVQLFFRSAGWKCRKLWPPFSPDDGVGLLEFAWTGYHEGCELIDRLLAGDARVVT